VEFFHKQTNFPFMATRKVWYALSVFLMIGSFVLLGVRGLNLAIDFTGGVNAEASFANTANVDAVREKLAAAGFKDPQVQNFGSSRDLSIRLPPTPGQNESSIRARLEPALKAVDPSAQVKDLAVVGPQVGSELRTSAI
jgi:preprotein translocase subunit SecF